MKNNFPLMHLEIFKPWNIQNVPSKAKKDEDQSFYLLRVCYVRETKLNALSVLISLEN